MNDPRETERCAADYADNERPDENEPYDAWEPTYRDGTPKCECWDSSDT